MPPNGVTVAGTPGPIQISEQLDTFIADAPERRLLYRGERVAVASQFGLLRVNSVHASFRQDGASATAEITLKDPTVVEILEIDFNAEQRQWYRAPANAGFSDAQIAAITGKLRELEAFAAAENSVASILAKTAQLASDLGGDLGDAFRDIILNGDTYLALLPVVTYTLVVSRTFATPFVILDIGKVFSTAAMSANLPLNPQLAIEEVTNTVAANALQTLGWLKTGRYSVTSDGGIQYIQQYTFDSWATRRYDFVT